MRKKLLNQALKKSLLLALAIFSIIGSSSLVAQTIEGGGGVLHVNGDPNDNISLADININEAHVALDTLGMIVYFYDASGTAYDGVTTGTQWIAVDVNAANPTVSGAGDITVNQTGTNYEVSFTETHTTLAFDGATKILTYTSEDGPATTINLSTVIDFDDSENIEVASGNGTTASPYTFLIVGSDEAANTGKVPVTDGVDGTLTWEKVVKSATFTATGELQLTFTDNTTVLVNMENIPTVANTTQLAAAAAAVDATSGGIARSAVTNTFGLPSTANSGVLFFISN